MEESNSEWAAPVLFAPKKDGKLRFCIDYRKLNAMTVKDSYPLPRMDECIDTLGDAKIFTTLDAFWGYWQIALSEKDKPKTSFRMPRRSIPVHSNALRSHKCAHDLSASA